MKNKFDSKEILLYNILKQNFVKTTDTDIECAVSGIKFAITESFINNYIIGEISSYYEALEIKNLLLENKIDPVPFWDFFKKQFTDSQDYEKDEIISDSYLRSMLSLKVGITINLDKGKKIVINNPMTKVNILTMLFHEIKNNPPVNFASNEKIINARHKSFFDLIITVLNECNENVDYKYSEDKWRLYSKAIKDIYFNVVPLYNPNLKLHTVRSLERAIKEYKDNDTK